MRTEPDFGKWLIIMGLGAALLGVVIKLFGKTLGKMFGSVGLFRLPGDLHFGSGNTHIYIPVTSCILLSIILTLIIWLINIFRNW